MIIPNINLLENGLIELVDKKDNNSDDIKVSFVASAETFFDFTKKIDSNYPEYGIVDLINELKSFMDDSILNNLIEVLKRYNSILGSDLLNNKDSSEIDDLTHTTDTNHI